MAKIKRKYQRNYTVIDNTVFDDHKLSLRAKGLFGLLWRQPADWSFSIAGTARLCGDGKDAIRSTIHELEAGGYLQREQVRSRGKFGSGDWILTENPNLDPITVKNDDQKTGGNTVVGKTVVGKTDTGQSAQNDTKPSETPMSVKPTSVKPTSARPTLLSNVVVDDVVGVDNARVRAKQNSTSNDDQEDQATDLHPTVDDLQDIQQIRLLAFWKRAFGEEPNFVIQKQFQSWLNEFQPDLVIHAAELGLLANRPSDKLVGYMRTILSRWASNGIRTVTDAEQAGKQFKQHQQQTHKQTTHQPNKRSKSKGKHRYKSKHGSHYRHEQLPEWAQTGVAKQQKKASPEQLQQTQQLLAELRSKHQTLAQLRKGGANNHDGKTRNANQ